MDETRPALAQLKRLAQKYRKYIVEMVYLAKAGHPGGSLSAIDIMTYLYETEIDLNESERSRFVMSKGHAVPALYAVLCGKGVISEDELCGFRGIASRLQGHTDVMCLPETEFSSGLLGQGLSTGVGMALGKKLKNSGKAVYVICGDGELHEGQMWEALMEGAHYKLDNLYLIVDRNRLSSGGKTDSVMNLEPLPEKMRAFGWHVEEIDGHDFEAIISCFERCAEIAGMPKCVVANTVKGKGVSFMENNPKWHSSALTDEEYVIAAKDLEEIL